MRGMAHQAGSMCTCGVCPCGVLASRKKKRTHLKTSLWCVSFPRLPEQQPIAAVCLWTPPTGQAPRKHCSPVTAQKLEVVASDALTADALHSPSGLSRCYNLTVRAMVKQGNTEASVQLLEKMVASSGRLQAEEGTVSRATKCRAGSAIVGLAPV